MTTNAARRALPNEEHARRSEFFADELELFEYLPVSRTDQSEVVLFGDDVWDFGSAQEWPASQPTARLNWRLIADPSFSVNAKEAAVLMMQPGAAIHLGVLRRRRKPTSPWSLYYTRYYFWVKWLNWLAEHDVSNLADVTQRHCDTWLSTVPKTSQNHAVGAIRVFADYRVALTGGGYSEGFRPFGERSAADVSGELPAPLDENKTPVIPDEVFAPLLQMAIYAVQSIGPAFLANQATTGSTDTREAAKFVTGRGAGSAVDEALSQYLLRLEEDGLPVPSTDGLKPSLHRIAGQLGLAGGGAALRKPERLAVINEASERLGLDGGTPATSTREPLAKTIERLLSGESVTLGTQTAAAVSWFVRTSALVTVASLTGMRTSELATITSDSVEKEELDSGLVRYRIKGKVLKGRKMGGRVERWLTVKEGAEAIEAAASLPDSNEGDPVFKVVEPRLDEYVAVANDLADALGMERISSEWGLYLRQFRRKVSREMAYRNFGIIAAMKALKHQSVLTTEGYAGAKGGALVSLQREIEAQREDVNLDEITRIYRGVMAGETVGGLGGKALLAAFEEAKSVLTSGGGKVSEDAIVAQVLKGFGGNLHTGPTAHCWFRDPAAARCLKGAEDRSKPLAGLCNPIDCPNATIHPQHAEVWIGNLTSLKASLKDRRVPAGERERLKPMIDKVEQIVESIGEISE